MPKLPSVESLERPQVQPGGTVVPIRAGEDLQAGAQLGETITTLGATLGAIDQTLKKSRQASELVEALGKASYELGTLEQQIDRDPDFKTAPQRFVEQGRGILSRYAESITDPTVKGAFSRQFQNRVLAKTLSVQTAAAKRETDYSVAQLDNALNVFAQSAASAGTPVERDLIMNEGRVAIESMRGAGWITEVDAVKRQKDFDAKFDQAQVLHDIATDPALTAVKLDSAADYAPNLDPVSRERLSAQASRRADQVANAQRVEAERLRVQGEREVKAAQNQRQEDLLKLWQAGKLDTKIIVNDDVLDFAQKHTLVNMVEEQNRGPIKTDNGVFLSLLNRIHLPDGDKNKIINENELLKHVKASGGINFEDMQRLRKEVRDLRDPEQGPFAAQLRELHKVAESDLTKTNNLAGIKDPKGDQLLYEYKWEVDQRIAKWKAEGKNPFDLLDPKNPNFLGKLLSTYRRTPMQIIQDMANEMRLTAPVPQGGSRPERKPGETPAEYLKRIGK